MTRVIIVGTDGSESADEAVRQAADLAATLGGRVHVVSAYSPVSGVTIGGDVPEGARATWMVGPTLHVDPPSSARRACCERAASTTRSTRVSGGTGTA